MALRAFARNAPLKNEVEHHFDLEKFRRAIKPLLVKNDGPILKRLT